MLHILKTSNIPPQVYHVSHTQPVTICSKLNKETLNRFNFLKPYCAVFAGFLLQSIVGGFLAVGNIIPYLASYVTYVNNISLINTNNGCTPEIESLYAHNVSLSNWILTASVIGYASFGPIGGSLYTYTQSMRCTTFVGGILLCIGIFSTYYTIQYMATIILFYGFIFGAGTGIFWGCSISACMNWFPKHRAFVTGFVILGMGLGQMIFDFMETLYINPTNINASSCGFIFQQQMLYKVPTCFFILLGFCLLCIILAILLFFENTIDPDEDDMEKLSTTRNYTSREAMKSYEFWLIFFNCFLNMIILTFVYAEWKIYAQRYLKITNDYFLLKTGMIAAVLNAFGRVFWGWLFDYTHSYKISMGSVTLLIAIFLATMPLCKFNTEIMAFIWINILYFSVGANYSILPSALSHTYGMKHNAVILGFITWSDIPSSILQSFIVNITQNKWILLCTIMSIISTLSFIVAMLYPSKKRIIKKDIQMKGQSVLVSPYSPRI